MYSHKFRLGVVPLWGLFIASQSFGGIKISSFVEQEQKKLPLTFYLEKSNLRIDLPDATGQTPRGAPARHRVIFDSATNQLTYLDASKKSMLRMPLGQLELFAQMAMKLQRPKSSGSAGPADSEPYSSQDLKKTKKVGRWTCNRHQVVRGKTQMGEICTASLDTLQLNKTDLVPLTQLARSIRPLMHFSPQQKKYPDFIWDRIQELGFAVEATSTAHSGHPAATYQVTNIERQNVAAAVFEAPPDYQTFKMNK